MALAILVVAQSCLFLMLILAIDERWIKLSFVPLQMQFLKKLLIAAVQSPFQNGNATYSKRLLFTSL